MLYEFLQSYSKQNKEPLRDNDFLIFY
jgi:hypothetical protein